MRNSLWPKSVLPWWVRLNDKRYKSKQLVHDKPSGTYITWCFFCLFLSFFLVYLDFGIYIKSVDQIRLFSRAVMLRQGHRPMTVLYVSSDSASTPSPCKEGHGNKLVACAGSSFSQHYAANDGEESHPEFHQKTNKQPCSPPELHTMPSTYHIRNITWMYKLNTRICLRSSKADVNITYTCRLVIIRMFTSFFSKHHSLWETPKQTLRIDQQAVQHPVSK